MPGSAIPGAGFDSPARSVKCPHCGEGIDVSQFGRGDEKVQSAQERQRQQSRDRYEDVNASTRPNEVTMADLKRRK
jgi:hypothetical protein